MKTRWVVLACLGLAALVGFAWSGPLFYRNVIGLDASGFPLGPQIQAVADAVAGPFRHAIPGVVLAFAGLLAVAAVTFFAVAAARRRPASETDPGRRGFLAGAGAGVGALVVGSGALLARAGFGVGAGGRGWMNVTGPALQPQVPGTHELWKETWKGAEVQSYRRLGRTEARVSDISLGSGPISGEKGEAIVRAALERGVTYIDTAPDYVANGSEEAIGRVLRDHDRSKLFIATKFCTQIGHLPQGSPPARYVEAVEGSLRRLNTDYVDLVHIHACDSVERLLDDGVHEAMDRLREQGKARFLGFSSHTPNMEQVANAAIDSGRFDIMMLAYHFGAWQDLGPILARARREQDMGVVAMKTLKGARHRGLLDFQPYADAYSQAAFKWVLSNEDVSCLVISFRELQHVDEYLHASGKPFTSADRAVLDEYDRQIAGTYCAPHCGECLEHCPAGLPVNDVLRYRMYAEDYGQEGEAMRLYAKLGRDVGAACAGCPAPCTDVCPSGLPVRERMLGADEMLRIS